ncbi:MAG: rod shape-determining protein RodA [Chloroflexi bacterium]|nr:rod shape-determining protein RodA [Chloroflexota bacterium]
MGVLRVERTGPSGLAARASGVAWRDYDIQLTVYAVLLAALGLAMAYSNTTAQAGATPGTDTTFARGVVWAVFALVAYALATLFDYRWLRTLTWPIYLVNLALLAATLVLGSSDAASARWISVLGFQFQFSELAKVLMILVLARFLADREARLDSLASIVGAGLIVGPPWVLVMLQPDLGTSLVFIAILVGMLFMTGASLRWLGALAAATLAALPLVWTYVLHDYQRERLTSFLDPARDPLGAGFQLLTAQKAVSSGGWLGAGLTNGPQNRADLLPVQTTDFVFAILAEELGFVGGLVVFLLFAALIWRVLAIAWRSRDPFGTAAGAGIASMILFQLMVNVGMVLGIMPITGIPLPFITHGGSSLTSMAIGLGVLQSIAIRQRRAEW